MTRVAATETEIAARMRALLRTVGWSPDADLTAQLARWSDMCGAVLDLMVDDNELVILEDPVLAHVYMFAASACKSVRYGHSAQRRPLDRNAWLERNARNLPVFEQERVELLTALDAAHPA